MTETDRRRLAVHVTSIHEPRRRTTPRDPDVSHYWRGTQEPDARLVSRAGLLSKPAEERTVLASGLIGSCFANAELIGILESGDLARADRFNEIWSVLAHRFRAQKELVFEAVRVRLEPHAPSRMRAAFAFESPHHVAPAMQTWGLTGTVYEIALDPETNAIRVDSMWLETRWHDQLEDRAARYWRGELSDTPRPEVLFEGGFELVRRL